MPLSVLYPMFSRVPVNLSTSGSGLVNLEPTGQPRTLSCHPSLEFAIPGTGQLLSLNLQSTLRRVSCLANFQSLTSGKLLVDEKKKRQVQYQIILSYWERVFPYDTVFQALLSLVFVDFAGVSQVSLQLQLGFICFVILPQLFPKYLVCIKILSLRGRSTSQLHLHLFLWHLVTSKDWVTSLSWTM